MSDRHNNTLLFSVLLTGTAIFTLAIASGLLPASDSTKVALIFFPTIAILASLNRLVSLSFAQFALLGLLFLHILNLCRDIYILTEMPFFDTGRLPLSMLIAIPVFIAGWRGLLTGPGFAAISVPVVFLSWAILASGFGQDPSHSYFYGGWMVFICALIALTRGLFKEPEEFWTGWLLGLTGLGTFTSILSIIAIIFDMPGARYQRWVSDASTGIGTAAPGFSGIFQSPNTLSTSALLSIAAALGLGFLWRRARISWLEPTLAICGVTVLLSGSRAGIIGCGLAMGSYIWLLWRERSTQRPSTNSGSTNSQLFRSVSLIILLIAFAATPVGRVGAQRLITSAELTAPDNHMGRDDTWRSFFKGLKERPVFGHGFQTKPMKDDWLTLRNMPGQVAKSAHSAPIEYGTTTGLPGVLLFLWMLWGGFRGLLKPGYRRFGESALVFWLCSCPIYLLYAHGNAPSAPAVWPLWVLLLTCRSINGQHESGQVAPPWVLRISRQQEKEFRAALPPFSSEAFGESQSRRRDQTKHD